MSQRNRDLAVRWFDEVWNQRRDETIDELSCPDCVGHIEGQDGASIADFRVMRAQLLGALPDMRLIVEDVIADDRAAVVRWRVDASHAPANKPITFSGMTWLNFKDGRIVEAWDRWNRDGLLRQLS
jgi:predicted ester cyclase